MKNDNKIGKDLSKSLIATSGLPETIEPMISAKTNIKFTNVNAVNKKKIIIKADKTADCFFCNLSKEDNKKLSLSKNFFITNPKPPNVQSLHHLSH